MMARGWLLEPLAMLVEAVWYFAVASVLVAALSDGSGPSLWLLIAAAGGGFYLSRLPGAFRAIAAGPGRGPGPSLQSWRCTRSYDWSTWATLTCGSYPG